MSGEITRVQALRLQKVLERIGWRPDQLAVSRVPADVVSTWAAENTEAEFDDVVAVAKAILPHGDHHALAEHLVGRLRDCPELG